LLLRFLFYRCRRRTQFTTTRYGEPESHSQPFSAEAAEQQVNHGSGQWAAGQEQTAWRRKNRVGMLVCSIHAPNMDGVHPALYFIEFFVIPVSAAAARLFHYLRL
jgi:hypothetical protein